MPTTRIEERCPRRLFDLHAAHKAPAAAEFAYPSGKCHLLIQHAGSVGVGMYADKEANGQLAKSWRPAYSAHGHKLHAVLTVAYAMPNPHSLIVACLKISTSPAS